MNEVEAIWREFCRIPLDDNNCVVRPFLHFPMGSNRYVIWEWIEETYTVKIRDLFPLLRDRSQFFGVEIGTIFTHQGIEYQKINWLVELGKVCNAVRLSDGRLVFFLAADEVNDG